MAQLVSEVTTEMEPIKEALKTCSERTWWMGLGEHSK